MQEHRLAVPRSARYFTLGATSPVDQVWVVCHGYGQLAARFLEKVRVLDNGRRYLVAPEGLSRFYLTDRPEERRVGASWMTREDRLAEIEDYVRYLDAVYAEVLAGIDRSRVSVFALGFSQGAPTVSRWAALGSAHIDHLILWGGDFPPDLDLTRAAVAERLRAARLTLVYGRADPFLTPKVVTTISGHLETHAIPCRTVPFDGGHVLDDAVLTSLAAQ